MYNYIIYTRDLKINTLVNILLEGRLRSNLSDHLRAGHMNRTRTKESKYLSPLNMLHLCQPYQTLNYLVGDISEVVCIVILNFIIKLN